MGGGDPKDQVRQPRPEARQSARLRVGSRWVEGVDSNSNSRTPSFLGCQSPLGGATWWCGAR